MPNRSWAYYNVISQIFISFAGDFMEISLSQQIDTIVNTHHAYVRAALSPILHGVDSQVRAHAGDARWQKLQEDFLALRQELEIHLAKEEAMVFPSFRHLEACEKGEAVLDLKKHDIRQSLDQMEYEHGATDEYLDALDQDMAAIGEDSQNRDVFTRLRELGADLEEHIRKEETELFPAARAIYYTLTRNLIREE